MAGISAQNLLFDRRITVEISVATVASVCSALCAAISACGDANVKNGSYGGIRPLAMSSFADRAGLVEVNVARAASGKGLRPQLDGVRRQVGVNGAAVEVSG